MQEESTKFKYRYLENTKKQILKQKSQITNKHYWGYISMEDSKK